jgi:hypothetical protein
MSGTLESASSIQKSSSFASKQHKWASLTQNLTSLSLKRTFKQRALTFRKAESVNY